MRTWGASTKRPSTWQLVSLSKCPFYFTGFLRTYRNQKQAAENKEALSSLEKTLRESQAEQDKRLNDNDARQQRQDLLVESRK